MGRFLIGLATGVVIGLCLYQPLTEWLLDLYKYVKENFKDELDG